MVVAKWEGALNEKRMQSALSHETDVLAEEPESVADAEASFALSIGAETPHGTTAMVCHDPRRNSSP